MERLLAGDVSQASAALAPLGFTVSSDVDSICGRRYAVAVSEQGAPPVVGDRVWGLYLVDLSRPPVVCFAVPHAAFDERTEQIAVDLWRRIPGSVMAMTTLYLYPAMTLVAACRLDHGETSGCGGDCEVSHQHPEVWCPTLMPV